ncbi:MAG: hypothetical protein K2X03_30090 [Bryobacteraceae bacterium]|nr:hypothetical protein [Bryobacteraceae bacterium]
MALVLRFYTRRFDVSKERPNPINPIPGESLLVWLVDQTKEKVELSAPHFEDWGWCSQLLWNGRRYLVAASASDEEEDGEREWVLQIHKHRSTKEKLLGRATMDRDDECAEHLLRIIQMEPTFRDVSVDPEP